MDKNDEKQPSSDMMEEVRPADRGITLEDDEKEIAEALVDDEE